MVSSHPSFPTEETFTFNRPLVPGRIAAFNSELDIPFDEGMTFTATLEYEADPALLNNTVEVEIPEPLIIKDGHFYTAMDDTNFDLLTIDGLASEVREYQNQSHFAATSIFQEPFSSLCPNIEEQIDANPFSVSSMSFCLDHSELHVPLLNFDLIQFRATEEIEFQELQPFSSALHLLYEHVDGSSEEKYIYNQTEGESVSHLEELPEYFNGRVSLEFFNYTGNFYGDDWLDYDVTLLDNLNIDAVFVNTKDPSSMIPIQVFPNPSAGQYFVKHEDIPTKLWISSVNGSLVQEIPVEGIKQTLDLSAFANGIYVLHSVYGDRGVGSVKLIKM